MVNSIYKKLILSPILALAAIAFTAVTTMPIAPAVASISTGQCEEVLGREVHIYIPHILQYVSPDYDNSDGDYYVSVSIGDSQEAVSDTVEGDNFDPGWHFHRFVPYEETTWLHDGYGGRTVLAISFSLIDEDAGSRYDELILEHLEQFDTDFGEDTFNLYNDYVTMDVAIESFETTGCASSLLGDSI
jgi:hypothetical protein